MIGRLSYALMVEGVVQQPTKKELAMRTIKATHSRSPANVFPAAFRTNETLAYLGGISAVTLYRWVAAGLLHPSRHSRYLLFSKEELDKFLGQTRNGTWKRNKKNSHAIGKENVAVSTTVSDERLQT